MEMLGKWKCLAKARYANFLEILIRISFAGAAGIYTNNEFQRRLTIIQDSLSIIFFNNIPQKRFSDINDAPKYIPRNILSRVF